MKIAEIVGSYADREEPDSSLLQNIANAFTRTGKVKRPLNQQASDGQPFAGYIPFSSFAASDEDPAADAASNTSTGAPIIPRHNPASAPLYHALARQFANPEKSSSESSIF
jgi:hypothetical protein